MKNREKYRAEFLHLFRRIMNRVTPEQRAILSLRGKIPEDTMAYMTKDDAYTLLKEITNQDFGYDTDKWENWIEENGLPALGIPPDKEVDHSVYAGLEFQKRGYTTRKCLRCGGELIITIEGKTHHIECENKDFTFSWTLP